MSLAKDQSLSVVVSGKTDAVLKARQLIVQNLQTPVCINCSLLSCLEYVNSCDFETKVLGAKCTLGQFLKVLLLVWSHGPEF